MSRVWDIPGFAPLEYDDITFRVIRIVFFRIIGQEVPVHKSCQRKGRKARCDVRPKGQCLIDFHLISINRLMPAKRVGKSPGAPAGGTISARSTV